MLALLHVEDEDAAALLLRGALNAAKINASVYRVSNGEQALKFLRMLDPYREVCRPDVIFLDLNMPRVDGWQVLTEVASDASLRSIPIIVLSTALRPDDRQRALDMGARHFICKPFVFKEWISEVQAAWKSIGSPVSSGDSARQY